MAPTGPNHRKRLSEDTDKTEYDTIVVRNLSPDTDSCKIVSELEGLGFRVHDVRNAVDLITKNPVPLFFLKLKKTLWNERIYKLKYIAHQHVKVERFQEPKKVSRCTKCQELGHCIDDCSSSPVCAYCSGPHLTRNCHFGRNVTPTCSRCKGAHPSNYKGCLVYKKQVRDMEKTMVGNAEQAASPQPTLEDFKPKAKECLKEFKDFSTSALNFLPPPKPNEEPVKYTIYDVIEKFGKNIGNFYSNNKEEIKVFFKE